MSVDYECSFILGWALTELELKAFHKATDYEYEDYVIRPNSYCDCEEDDIAFLGDQYGSIDLGQYINCDVGLKKVVAIPHGVTAIQEKAKWRNKLINAGWDDNHILFEAPTNYLVNRVF